MNSKMFEKDFFDTMKLNFIIYFEDSLMSDILYFLSFNTILNTLILWITQVNVKQSLNIP